MATILDQFGNPLQREVLAEPQTSRLGWLAHEFDTHPSRGLTPPKLASILQGAEQGDLIDQSNLFLDMEEKDGHIFSEMSKRKRALLTLDWDIEPPREASKAEQDDAAWLRDTIQDIDNLDDVLLDALDGIGHGFSALEIEWQLLGREWLPKAINHRPQSWFRTAQHDRNKLRLRDNTPDGAELIPFGWIVHVHKAKSGYLARGGLHRVLAWPYLFKNYGVRDLAEFLEIYGLPLRLGKYPPGASSEEKATLLRAVMNIGHNAAGIIPEGMAIDFQEAAKGASDPYMAMIDWAERTQSKVIVGQTTSSEAKNTGLGSGVANLHADVRDDLTKSDARQLGGTLTRDLCYPLLALNRGVRDPRRLPRFVFDTGEAEDISLYAEALPKLVGVGFRIPASWAHDKLRIPTPKEDEAVLSVSPSGAPEAGNKDQGKAAARAALKTVDLNQPDEFDQLADDMSGDWERVTGPLLEPITALAAACKSFAEFNERLPEVIGQMDADTLTELLAQGQFVAHVWGRVNGDQ